MCSSAGPSRRADHTRSEEPSRLCATCSIEQPPYLWRRTPMAEHEPAEYVLEIVTPRTNAARLSAAEDLFNALALAHGREADSIALEIVADSGLRRFQLRTTSVTDQQRIGRLLGAAYPQADLRPLGASDTPTDAARQGPDEQCAACVLRPRRGEYLPLRTFVDRDLDGGSGCAC